MHPLPHQITAVYDALLPRQPLRFLVAYDLGAGKTIIADLFMKKLIARGDLQRWLVMCPGRLAEQWQDELYRRFHLPFEILTNSKLEAAHVLNRTARDEHDQPALFFSNTYPNDGLENLLSDVFKRLSGAGGGIAMFRLDAGERALVRYQTPAGRPAVGGTGALWSAASRSPIPRSSHVYT